MNTTGIRIDVPDDLYGALSEMQDKWRRETGKKPSLSSVIISLCQSALDGTPIEPQSVQNVKQGVHNKLSNQIPSQEPIASKHNQQMDTYYCRWESALNDRALMLRAQENELAEAREDFFQKQNDFIAEKESVTIKSLAGPDQIIELKLCKMELAQKNETIQSLLEEKKTCSASILKSLNNLEQAAKNNEKGEETIWDKIIPWIPAAVNVIGLYLIYNKVDGKSDLSGLPQQISSILTGLDPENKQKVTQTIMSAVQSFVKTQPDKSIKKDYVKDDKAKETAEK